MARIIKLLVIAVFSFQAVVIAQAGREVFITLDVSGSMNNDKYILANYTAQLISTLCEQDEVYLIIYSHTEKISGGKDMYKKIQIRYDDLGSAWKVEEEESQIEDIREFNEQFKQVNAKEQWLFIIGDGIWDTFKHPLITNEFRNIARESGVHICYLQTGSSDTEHNDFTVFLEDLKIVEIHKSSTRPSSIMDNCNKVAGTILGLSSTSLELKQESAKCLSVETKLPARKFILIYQDDVVEASLPVLVSVNQGGNPLPFDHKGTPSTSPLLSSVAAQLVSGSVWVVEPGILIPAGAPVQFCFDRNIDKDRIRVFPVMDIKITGSTPSITTGALKQIDETSVAVCKENDSAMIRISLADENGLPLPQAILRNTSVEIISENKAYPATYKGGMFECDLPLAGETTLYYSRSECPGYFNKTSRIYKIIKTDDCPPQKPPVPPETTYDESYLGSITFNEMMRGDCKEFGLIDSATLADLDPAKFDISVRHDYNLLFKKVEIKIENQKVVICFEPRGDWCDCLFPDTLKLRVKISPKEGIDFGGKVYGTKNFPSSISLIKDSWFMRCKSIIFAMIAALLTFIYLFRLSRKPRFKKGSLVSSEFSDYYDKFPPYRFYLRKKGFSHWLNRWFNPFGSEKRSIVFTEANKTIKFLATNSIYRIKFPRAAFDKSYMNYVDYDEDDDDPYIMFSNGYTLTIKTESANEGKLKVDYDMKEGIFNDIPPFRFFLILLMTMLTIFFLSGGIILIKSLLL